MRSFAQHIEEQNSRRNRRAGYFKKLVLNSSRVVSGELEDVARSVLYGLSPHHTGSVYVLEDVDKRAFCLPSNDIFISTGLLTVLDSKDQLGFIIGHELSHIKHTERDVAAAKTLGEYYHARRLEEYVADAEGFLQLNRNGNPVEGIKALEKINTDKYGGAVHGDTQHRILNLFWVTRLLDLEGIERPPEGLKLSFENLKTSLAPDLHVFEKLDRPRRVYEKELEKCKNHYAVIAAYQQLLKTSPQCPEEQTVFEALSYDLFSLLADCFKRTLADGRLAPACAEAVKTFCCGDIEPRVEISRELLAVLDYSLFDRLGVVPTFTEEDFVSEYVKIQSRKSSQDSLKLLQEFKGRICTLVESFRISTDYDTDVAGSARAEGLKIFGADTADENGENHPTFSESFKGCLRSMRTPEKIASLLHAKEIYAYLSNEPFADVWANDPPLEPHDFNGSKRYLEWLAVCRAVVGDSLDMKLTNRGEGYNVESSNPALVGHVVGHLEKLAANNRDFRKAVRLIKGVYPAKINISLERLSADTEQYLVEATRIGLLRRAQTSQALCDCLDLSFREYPPTSRLAYYEEYKKLFKSVPEKERRLKLLLSFFFDPIKASKIQAELLPQYFKECPFDDALDFITNHFGFIKSLKPFEYMLEERPQTIQELECVRALPSKMLAILGRDRREELADFAFAELLSKFASFDRLELTKRLLDKSSDRMVKRFVYDYARHMENIFNMINSIEDDAGDDYE